jgi:hypothetical protein
VPWATEAEVAEITGVTVTAERLTQAQSVIELYVGRTEGSQVWPAAQSGWLKKAVAYQAAWMPAQPDLLTRAGVERVSQDGATVEFTGDGQHLAPLAKKALRRLGWRGTRSIYTPPVRGGQYAGNYYPAAEGVGGVRDFADDPWRPL